MRSRAAFKLSQINRQYPFLESARVVLDLCAAPGGWTQIAARTCAKDSHIIAVDILPIRSLGLRNCTTIVGDITTDQCKAEIRRTVRETTIVVAGGRDNSHHGKRPGAGVDVVLHDGAPNVGASYDKDAYEQLELCLHALKCATDHLKRGGHFITKVYRSRDASSLVWVLQQLFQQVDSFKPKASRVQSAEIFYVCQGYHAPDKLDPRLLDPAHVFEHVEGATDGGEMSARSSKMNVFHKAWDAAKRQRGGYDTEHLDATLRHVEPVTHFVFGREAENVEGGSANANTSASATAAIHVLSTCTGLTFRVGKDAVSSAQQKEQSDFLLNHPLTTTEIKECLTDLKVLNKADFKGLMTWREKMLSSWEEANAEESDDGDEDDESDEDEEMSDADREKEAGDDDEDAIQKEIQAMREKKIREKKRREKKDRKLAAKKRKQAAMGMDLNAIEVQEHDQFFSLASVGMSSTKDLDRVAEVNLDKVTHDEAFGPDDEDDDDDDENAIASAKPERDEDTGYSFRLDSELDAAYERYLLSTKNGAAKTGTQSAKRSKRLMREKLAQESHEDAELLLSKASGLNHDAKAYAKLLTQGGNDSDDDESDDENQVDDDDGFDAEPVTPDEHEQQRAKKKAKLATALAASAKPNPLLSEFPDDPTPVKTARWFSNPLFAQIGQVVNSATSQQMASKQLNQGMDADDGESTKDAPHAKLPKRQRGRNQSSESNSNGDSDDEALDADGVLALMPKTDKQKRHEKRIKAKERDERRQKRIAKRMGDSEQDFDLAPADTDVHGGNDDDNLDGMSDERKRKVLEARKLIKAGLGQMNASSTFETSGFEVVEAHRPLPVQDSRKYDSDHEEYDSDDHAQTMALGTMMLRQSKAKALVDASYNRYAWNDPSDLPEWFVDDENRHYRPQLPIPPALLAKMKEKMIALSTKPIAKVAEARARKNRKAKAKLATAKKRAQAVANSSEMSDVMKLKSISKALRSEDAKKSGKKYVVAKKGQGKKGVKGATVVDKRMKNDKRSMDRATKKRQGGKKGGLTGGKRRRHHK